MEKKVNFLNKIRRRGKGEIVIRMRMKKLRCINCESWMLEYLQYDKTKSSVSIGYIQLLGSHLDNRSNENRIRQKQNIADR